MNHLLKRALALALLIGLGAGPASAQDPPAADGGPCQKEVHAVVATEHHTRVCYDCKDEDYAYTHWVHSPILTIFCHDHCGKCACGPDEAEPCHNCGQPRTRKVLIKILVTEPVATPQCKVERVPCAAAPAVPSCTNPEDMVLHEGELQPPAPRK